MQKSGYIDLIVDASAEAVWRVVSDVTRTGEWSYECQQARWLDGASSAAPGVRFRGRNRIVQEFERVAVKVTSGVQTGCRMPDLHPLMPRSEINFRGRSMHPGSGTRFTQPLWH